MKVYVQTLGKTHVRDSLGSMLGHPTCNLDTRKAHQNHVNQFDESFDTIYCTFLTTDRLFSRCFSVVLEYLAYARVVSKI